MPKLYTTFITLQINETTTAILGGFEEPHRILTYEWATGTYRKMEAQLEGARTESACALATDAMGQKLVLIAATTKTFIFRVFGNPSWVLNQVKLSHGACAYSG